MCLACVEGRRLRDCLFFVSFRLPSCCSFVRPFVCCGVFLHVVFIVPSTGDTNSFTTSVSPTMMFAAARRAMLRVPSASSVVSAGIRRNLAMPHARRSLLPRSRSFATLTDEQREMMTAEREHMDFDVLIVGAGPAGLGAAIRVKQLAQV